MVPNGGGGGVGSIYFDCSGINNYTNFITIITGLYLVKYARIIKNRRKFRLFRKHLVYDHRLNASVNNKTKIRSNNVNFGHLVPRNKIRRVTNPLSNDKQRACSKFKAFCRREIQFLSNNKILSVAITYPFFNNVFLKS